MPAFELLNADGRPTMATIFLMVHHAFRRDVARLATGLATSTDPERLAALREGWQTFTTVLHGHHEAEDTRMFPSMRATNEAAFDALSADHRLIDPLLARIDAALGALPERRSEAIAAVNELAALLGRHLEAEEAVVIPIIRAAPLDGLAQVPASEYPAMTEGFAWSAEGVAADIVEVTHAALPEAIRARLGAARAAQDAKSIVVWGSVAEPRSRTCQPA